VAWLACCAVDKTLHFLEVAGTRVLPYEGKPAALPVECSAGWRHHTTPRDVEYAVAARAPQNVVVRRPVVLQQSGTHMRIFKAITLAVVDDEYVDHAQDLQCVALRERE
jgi:hypothetical protein